MEAVDGLPSRESTQSSNAKEEITTLRKLAPLNSYKNLPELLKVTESSPTVAIAMSSSGPPNTDVSYNTRETIGSNNTTVEVSIDGNYEEEEEEEEEDNEDNEVTMATTPAIANRPSVINLGITTLDSKTTPPIQSPLPTPDTPTMQHYHSNGERPERMREWLVRMINSGRFPGLEWLDHEKMIFRVPWVHAKKRDYNQERDAALFKEWAIHSGKYGDGSDVTTWKINFRCALNGLKDITERKDLEGPDCRIYQMLPSTSLGRRRKRRRPIIHYSEMMQMKTTPTDVVAREIRPKLDLMSGMSSLTPIETTPSTPAPLSTGPLQLVPIVTRPHSFQFPIPMASFQSTSTAISQHLPMSPVLPKYYPVSYKPVSLTSFDMNRNIFARPDRVLSVSSDSSKTPPIDSTNTDHSNKNHFNTTPLSSPLSVNVLHQDKGSFAMYPPLRHGNISWPPSEFADNPDALTFRVMYGSITVHIETIDAAKGVRLFYGPLHCREVLPRAEEETLFGPINAHQISLSPRHPSPLASEIFKTLKRGLVIDVENHNIHATALCRAVVYCGSSPHKNSTTINKEERVKLFDFSNEFLPALRQSTELKGSVYPKPYVILSLGQPWGTERLLSQNLITIVVTHCRALNSLRVRNVNILDELLYEPYEHHNIRIISPTRKDLEAEEFLNPPSNPATPY